CLIFIVILFFFFFSSRRRHTRFSRDWSSDVCSSDLYGLFYATHANILTSDISKRSKDLSSFCTIYRTFRYRFFKLTTSIKCFSLSILLTQKNSISELLRFL